MLHVVENTDQNRSCWRFAHDCFFRPSFHKLLPPREGAVGASLVRSHGQIAIQYRAKSINYELIRPRQCPDRSHLIVHFNVSVNS